ncbi:elongation factor 1-alpha C-terminal domain-related protein, partial [Rhizobium brockwellii]
ARGDMIVSIDAQPQVGLAFDAQIVALQPEGIEPGKRYWLKSGSRRQRVQVQPLSQLELKTGTWNAAQRLYMNAIGKVRLIFDEAAIF